MEKIKVGDYVRNKYGIAKIIDIENKNGIDILVFDKDICFLVNKKTGEIKEDKLFDRLAIIDNIDINKINSSPNIIDLIEVGDYVNGSRVIDIVEAPYKAIYVERDFQNINLVPIIDREINSILTKEKFENMEYKI